MWVLRCWNFYGTWHTLSVHKKITQIIRAFCGRVRFKLQLETFGGRTWHSEADKIRVLRFCLMEIFFVFIDSVRKVRIVTSFTPMILSFCSYVARKYHAWNIFYVDISFALRIRLVDLLYLYFHLFRTRRYKVEIFIKIVHTQNKTYWCRIFWWEHVYQRNKSFVQKLIHSLTQNTSIAQYNTD